MLGLIASVGTGGNESDIDLVKNLVSMYISKPSCIVLLTVACESTYLYLFEFRLSDQRVSLQPTSRTKARTTSRRNTTRRGHGR